MISDDELVCFHYQDGLSAERLQQIRQALHADPQLQSRLAELGALLQACRELPAAPTSAATRLRWQQALARAEQSQQQRRAGRRRHWDLAIACTLLLGVGIGMRLNESTPPQTAALAAVDEASLTRGVRAHLRDARLVLAQWPQRAPDQREALLQEVLAQNRAYVSAAERAGDQRLARVLRAFEPVLQQLEISATDPELGAGARAQLDFELGVMQTKLLRTPSNELQRL